MTKSYVKHSTVTFPQGCKASPNDAPILQIRHLVMLFSFNYKWCHQNCVIVIRWWFIQFFWINTIDYQWYFIVFSKKNRKLKIQIFIHIIVGSDIYSIYCLKTLNIHVSFETREIISHRYHVKKYIYKKKHLHKTNKTSNYLYEETMVKPNKQLFIVIKITIGAVQFCKKSLLS